MRVRCCTCTRCVTQALNCTNESSLLYVHQFGGTLLGLLIDLAQLLTRMCSIDLVQQPVCMRLVDLVQPLICMHLINLMLLPALYMYEVCCVRGSQSHDVHSMSCYAAVLCCDVWDLTCAQAVAPSSYFFAMPCCAVQYIMTGP